jgi:hypothetical protein
MSTHKNMPTVPIEMNNGPKQQKASKVLYWLRKHFSPWLLSQPAPENTWMVFGISIADIHQSTQISPCVTWDGDIEIDFISIQQPWGKHHTSNQHLVER